MFQAFLANLGVNLPCRNAVSFYDIVSIRVYTFPFWCLSLIRSSIRIKTLEGRIMPKYIHYFCSRKINCCCHLIGTSSVTTGFLFFTVILPFFWVMHILLWHLPGEFFLWPYVLVISKIKKPKKIPCQACSWFWHIAGTSEPFPSHPVCSGGSLHLQDLLFLLRMPIQGALRAQEQPDKAEGNTEICCSGFSLLLSRSPKSFLAYPTTWEVCCSPKSPLKALNFLFLY